MSEVQPVQDAATPAETRPKAKPKTGNTMSRIKLALLEQYSAQAGEAGSDPYNQTSGSAKPDMWRGNARRI